MAEQRVIKLDLRDCMLDEVNGDGDHLTIKLRAFRTTKAGTPERYELSIGICRFGVRRFLGMVKEMHVRDRDRITRELQRIENEIGALRMTP